MFAPFSMKTWAFLSCLSLLPLTATAADAADLKFEIVNVDPQPGKVVYAVTAADVDGDGKTDAVAVTEEDVFWYQAPDWNRRVILRGQTATDNVCIAPQQIDGDGKIDFALGAGWPRNGGTIQWLSRGESLDEPWQVHPIAAQPWTHRMRWGNMLQTADGSKQLIVSPLNATRGPGVHLMAYQIPEDPKRDRWKPTLINAQMDRLHNHWCTTAGELGWSDLAAETPVTLTASQSGVHAIVPAGALASPETNQQQADTADDGAASPQGQTPRFVAYPVTGGASGDEPAGPGAGEVKPGRLADGTRFLVTIEPMHGTHAVLYRLGDSLAGAQPQRTVLTDQLRGGHAVWCANLDQDADDEVVVGHREPNPQVGIYVFDHQDDGSWSGQAIDPDGVACEDLIVADFDGDGRGDILAGGRATHNVRLYLNRGAVER